MRGRGSMICSLAQWRDAMQDDLFIHIAFDSLDLDQRVILGG